MSEAAVQEPVTMQEQLHTWVTSFPDYAQDLLMVQTVEGKLEPFQLNNVQRAVGEIVEDIRNQGRLVRALILKLRRVGISTKFAGRNYWLTNTNPHTNALMITHEPDATDTIFNMHKRFHANVPPKLRAQVLYDNRKVLEFNTKNRAGGLDSSIRVGTAGKENFGSSQLVNYAHFSEFAKWPTHCIKSLMTSLMPCIPKTHESELIIESTAYGIGNMFYSMYWAARYKYKMYLDENGDLAWRCEVDAKAPDGNTWSAIFIPWFVFERNEVPVVDWERQTGLTFELIEKEQEIINLHLAGVPPVTAKRKIAWRRLSIINDFEGDEKRFNQENPATDHEAFISSGEPAFDVYKINAMLALAPEPIAKYEIDLQSGQFMASPTGRLWVWEEHRPGEAYAIPADVSQGVVVDESNPDAFSKHDFSVCSVKHQLTRRECAQWHGKIDPTEYGRLLVHLGRRYNMAWLIPESNNDGNTVIAEILRLKYKRLFIERVVQPPNPPRKRYGFRATGSRDSGTRAEAVNALISLVNEGKHGIRSKRTYEEMLAFKRNAKGKFVAEHRRHDDCVTMEAVGAFCIPLLPLPAMMRNLAGAPQAVTGTNTATTTEGWT